MKLFTKKRICILCLLIVVAIVAVIIGVGYRSSHKFSFANTVNPEAVNLIANDVVCEYLMISAIPTLNAEVGYEMRAYFTFPNGMTEEQRPESIKYLFVALDEDVKKHLFIDEGGIDHPVATRPNYLYKFARYMSQDEKNAVSKILEKELNFKLEIYQDDIFVKSLYVKSSNELLTHFPVQNGN